MLHLSNIVKRKVGGFMKLIRYGILLTLMIGITVFLVYIYVKTSTDNVTLDSIVSNKDYNITQVKDHSPISFSLEPEWISKHTNDKHKVFEINQHQIFLVSVKYRENDIYFSFHTKLKLPKKKGSFIYPGTIQDSGVFSTPREELRVLTLDNKIIQTTQIGIGPSSDFSFGINKTDQDKIIDGFKVEFEGIKLYNYFLKDPRHAAFRTPSSMRQHPPRLFTSI
ncbi:hypothetical protein JJQ72_14880 [Paenibacillus sp. F411]|uniref:hypothetical protein n=1 Tax=Paenibacillus sp. F411 TaxID=2820239 RepID=UPI001AAEBF60|nr:hypothetical protein [Paenibacillus sp. F411]MBO2945261.1 hypothetical protein [Paenibacillus sp. F411]